MRNNTRESKQRWGPGSDGRVEDQIISRSIWETKLETETRAVNQSIWLDWDKYDLKDPRQKKQAQPEPKSQSGTSSRNNRVVLNWLTSGTSSRNSRVVLNWLTTRKRDYLKQLTELKYEDSVKMSQKNFKIKKKFGQSTEAHMPKRASSLCYE